MKTYRVALLGLTAGAALALIAPAANADGMARRGPAPVGCAPFCWSGLYVGLNAGWQQTDVEGTYAFTRNRHDVDHDSAILGGHIGYSAQWGAAVLGLEASWSGAAWSDNWGHSGPSPSSSCGPPAAGGAGPANLNCEGRLEYLVTVGPRLGWTWDTGCCNSAMLYVTGGYAQASVATRVNTRNQMTTNGGFTLPVDGANTTKASHDGWFIGTGVEYAISRNVILGLEYLHVELDTVRHLTNNGNFDATTRDVDADTNIVRARVTFKIGADAPRPLK